jgi:uncharacterized membrane protein YdbT with pleckstrin-like domain
MSSYVDSVLAEGEQIVYRASISHWKYFLSYFIGGLFVLAPAAVYIATGNRTGPWLTLYAIALTLGLVMILAAVIRRQTTELVLTNRRIITKRGLVSRDTVEMNLGKVESLHVKQGLVGRIFDYGDVTVVGTGASLEPLEGVARPLELRRMLGGAPEVVAPAK